MKRILLYVAFGILALGSGAFVAHLRAQQTRIATPLPTIPAPTATPEVIPVNTPTEVTVTVPISDPRVIPTGVNLLRVNDIGPPTNLGRMYDDGTNGDVVSRDKIFTTRTNLNELRSGSVQFRISAAFRGLLRRIQSNIGNVAIWEEHQSELGVSFLHPPDWTIVEGSDQVSLISAARLPLFESALEAETPPDITIVRLNSSGANLATFSTTYANGWFTHYANSANTFVGGKPAIRFNDLGSRLGHAPVEAVFVDASDSIFLVSMNSYENNTYEQTIEYFDALLSDLEVR